MADDLFSRDPPPCPPQSDRDRLDRLRLIRSRRVGPATFHRLMREYGSATAALKALPEVAKAAGVTDYTPCPPETAAHEFQAARGAGARPVWLGEADYPAALLDLADAPPLLWLRGTAALFNRPAVALVGARNASSLGRRMAQRLAADLSGAGYAIVSGLARGIDTAAHRAALKGGTAAVLAGGVDVIYPAENGALADEILTTGALLSERPMGMQPLARHFPARNRIISGLVRGVVVVEAALKSGSLITARNALDQGREVLATPGHPIDARASGCNALIRDGATLVRGAADVIEALGAAKPAPPAEGPDLSDPPEPAPVPAPAPAVPGNLQKRILGRLSTAPVAIDQLIRDLDLPARMVTPELTTLELEGRIERRAGGLVALAAA